MTEANMMGGWSPFEDLDEHAAAGSSEIASIAAGVFSKASGRRVLEHLRTITTATALPPSASDAALRHLEGQRALVLYLERLIEQGRTP
jgi:hypothetical protein